MLYVTEVVLVKCLVSPVLDSGFVYILVALDQAQAEHLDRPAHLFFIPVQAVKRVSCLR